MSRALTLVACVGLLSILLDQQTVANVLPSGQPVQSNGQGQVIVNQPVPVVQQSAGGYPVPNPVQSVALPPQVIQPASPQVYGTPPTIMVSATCPVARPAVDCTSSTVCNQECPAYPNAVCRIDNCGGCQAKFFLQGVHVCCGECPNGFSAVRAVGNIFEVFNPCLNFQCKANEYCRPNYCPLPESTVARAECKRFCPDAFGRLTQKVDCLGEPCSRLSCQANFHCQSNACTCSASCIFGQAPALPVAPPPFAPPPPFNPPPTNNYQPPPQSGQVVPPPNYYQPPPQSGQVVPPPNYYQPPPQSGQVVPPPNYYQPPPQSGQVVPPPNYYQPPPQSGQVVPPPNYYQPPPQVASPPPYHPQNGQVVPSTHYHPPTGQAVPPSSYSGASPPTYSNGPPAIPVVPAPGIIPAPGPFQPQPINPVLPPAPNPYQPQLIVPIIPLAPNPNPYPAPINQPPVGTPSYAGNPVQSYAGNPVAYSGGQVPVGQPVQPVPPHHYKK